MSYPARAEGLGKYDMIINDCLSSSKRRGFTIQIDTSVAGDISSSSGKCKEDYTNSVGGGQYHLLFILYEEKIDNHYNQFLRIFWIEFTSPWCNG